MIKAIFRMNEAQDIVSFELSGHAGSGPYGEDIICAAVSVVVIGTINNIERQTAITPLVSIDEVNEGYIYMELPESMQEVDQETSQILLKGLYDILSEDLASEYPQFLEVLTEPMK